MKYILIPLIILYTSVFSFSITVYASLKEIPVYIQERNGRLVFASTDDMHFYEELLPGDCIEYDLIICNDTPQNINIYIKENSNRTSSLKDIVFTLKTDKNTLYNRTLNNHLVSTIKAEGLKKTVLHIEYYFPIDCGNRYADKMIESDLELIAESDNSKVSLKKSDMEAIYIYTKPETENPVKSKGRWKNVIPGTSLWRFNTEDDYACGGWIYAYNPYSTAKEKYQWFCFDGFGNMLKGWYRYDYDTWYYLSEYNDGNLGSLYKGWLKPDIQDGYYYYLDNDNGRMYHGWNIIDSQEYYFTDHRESNVETWIKGIIKEINIPYWLYTFVPGKPYGSLYRNELTPDGRYADSNGKIISGK